MLVPVSQESGNHNNQNPTTVSLLQLLYWGGVTPKMEGGGNGSGQLLNSQMGMGGWDVVE